MPGHKLHNASILAGVALISPVVGIGAGTLGLDPVTVSLGFGLGMFQCVFVTPDWDVDRGDNSIAIVRKISPALAMLFYWYTLPYRKVFKHRGSSHWPVFGTLTRLVYFPVIPILTLLGVIPLEFAILLVAGQMVGDIIHWGLDQLDKALGGAL